MELEKFYESRSPWEVKWDYLVSLKSYSFEIFLQKISIYLYNNNIKLIHIF